MIGFSKHKKVVCFNLGEVRQTLNRDLEEKKEFRKLDESDEAFYSLSSSEEGDQILVDLGNVEIKEDYCPRRSDVDKLTESGFNKELESWEIIYRDSSL